MHCIFPKGSQSTAMLLFLELGIVQTGCEHAVPWCFQGRAGKLQEPSPECFFLTLGFRRHSSMETRIRPILYLRPELACWWRFQSHRLFGKQITVLFLPCSSRFHEGRFPVYPKFDASKQQRNRSVPPWCTRYNFLISPRHSRRSIVHSCHTCKASGLLSKCLQAWTQTLRNFSKSQPSAVF